MKRLFAFLLAITFIPISALAAVINPGSGGVSPGSGHGGTGSPWSSRTSASYGAGLLLHIERMDKKVYFTLDSSGEYQVEGFSDVLKYWTNHFPDTDPNVTQTGIYLLPTWRMNNNTSISPAAIQHKANGTIDYSYQEVSYIDMTSSTAGTDIVNMVGRSATLAAVQSRTEANPNPTMSPTYWQDLAVSQVGDIGSYANIVSKLYSGSNGESGITSSTDIDYINANVNQYIIEDSGKTKKRTQLGAFLSFHFRQPL